MSEFMCGSCRYGKVRQIDLLTGNVTILCDNHKCLGIEDLDEEAKHCRYFEESDEE